ncbi:Protein translocase complex, SecE/Sec61-gamma subunit [Propionibacterium ruminifibrarum]|uniref:Protein translocase subunit SecE n=1 Tax=Propionibacterium ruminifibrarum TaxID=1962131 RepID=A0A375I1U6_9ACTN|nr:preprotein translocase subunit SecE [Propionibacterium ruminifibrarum]SPF68782.1 Protein translocase complex, SecE/Sec61-gamma subunit [Propionibacterium ruminifibrarum]
MAEETKRADEAADADERASQDELATTRDAETRKDAPARGKRSGKPRRHLAQDEDAAPVKTIERKHTTAPTRRTGTAKKKPTEAAKRGRTTPWAFAKQSVGELKKVIWPSGQEVSQYFVVVLVFVVFIMAIVAGLDFGFTKLLLKLFG